MGYKKLFGYLIASLLIMNILIVSVSAQEQINKNTIDKIGDFFKGILNKITGKKLLDMFYWEMGESARVMICVNQETAELEHVV